MSNIFIYGHGGSIGRRYRAVLEHLGHKWAGKDPKSLGGDSFQKEKADAFIVASPTGTHVEIVSRLLSTGKPILCEKPVCHDALSLEKLLQAAAKANAKLQIVSQYDYLVPEHAIDVDNTSYDFYHTGPDGMLWDCYQVVEHAKGKIRLSNKSPIWRCVINGHELDKAKMDEAYVLMVRDFLAAPRSDLERIRKGHAKVRKVLASKNLDRHSGTLYVDTAAE